MILLAVSGGPDSMYLLYKYRRHKIVVAHVNYQVRDESDNDQKIVEKFCKKYAIPCEVLNVQTKASGNFQTWARQIRYQFFEKIANKYHVKKLLTAHHKDDFLETALMQQRSGRTPKYFGIKAENNLFNLKIKRPLLHKLWKREIERFLSKHHIDYAIDISNQKLLYTRNKIRHELSKLPFSEKRKYYEWFIMSNKILVKKYKKIDLLFKKWQKTKFDTRFFEVQRFKHELVYEYIHKFFANIKLSNNKIESIIDFIISNHNNKFFKLNNCSFLIKNNFKLSIKLNKEKPIYTIFDY